MDAYVARRLVCPQCDPLWQFVAIDTYPGNVNMRLGCTGRAMEQVLEWALGEEGTGSAVWVCGWNTGAARRWLLGGDLKEVKEAK